MISGAWNRFQIPSLKHNTTKTSIRGITNIHLSQERLIRQVIREHFADCTVIAVVHRLGAVADFDRVAVMGGGRLLEWDSPQALLARDSKFKRLWNLGSGV